MPATAPHADPAARTDPGRPVRVVAPAPSRGGRGPLAGLWRTVEGPRLLDLSVLLIGVSTALLTLLGLVMVLSSSSVEAIGAGMDSYALFLRQLGWAAVGVVLLLTLAFTPIRFLKALAWPVIIAATVLLFLVAFTPLGVTVNGNTNWLNLGGGMRFQPSEAAKLALALWPAAVLERKSRLTMQVRHALVPVLPAAGLLILFVMKGRDLGTALIMATIVMTVLFIAGTHRGVFLWTAAGLAVGALGMTLFAAHRLVRVQAWLGDCSDPSDPCFQPAHGIYALASGGWWGVGLGQSRQKWSYIPEAENDFIFTILGEELGLLGTLVVVAAFIALAVGMYRVAAGTTSTFIRLTTWGIMAWLVGQAFMNIAMVTGLLPVVGVPLPFISYGGSALTLALSGVGIVLSFARHERRRQAERTAEAPGGEDAAEAGPQRVGGAEAAQDAAAPVPRRPELRAVPSLPEDDDDAPSASGPPHASAVGTPPRPRRALTTPGDIDPASPAPLPSAPVPQES